jgi:hypothetical protein
MGGPPALAVVLSLAGDDRHHKELLVAGVMATLMIIILFAVEAVRTAREL